MALTKIWLFNNRLTDRGAEHVGRMLGDTVTEVGLCGRSCCLHTFICREKHVVVYKHAWDVYNALLKGLSL